MKKVLEDRQRDTDAHGAGDAEGPGEAASTPTPGPSSDTVETVVQAMLLVSASGLRHYAGLVEALGRFVPALLSQTDRGHTIRTCLREMADLSVDESRRLRAQMDRVDPTSAAPPTGPPTGAYWRRWKSKP